MARNKKSQGTEMLYSALIGMASSFFVCICLSLVCPVLLLNNSMDAKHLQVFAHVTRVLATSLGVWIACRLTLDRKLLTGMLCAVVWFFLSVGFSVLFLSPDGFMVVGGLLGSIVGALVALLICGKEGRSMAHKRRKR